MIVKLIRNNLLYKPLSTALSLVLLAFGTGIISVLMLLQQQFRSKFNNDMKDIDLVVGAKGSPLQLVLSAVYQIDAPTGNISKAQADSLRRNPYVEQLIPLAYGDGFEGYRIVGTDSNYISKYHAVYSVGRLFARPMEVVLGSNVAARTGLVVGQHFVGTHGLAATGEKHAEFPYTVTGVLKETGTVLDNLVITPVESVWKIHEAHHDDDDVASEHHDVHASPEVTAALIKLRTPMGLMLLPRILGQGTNMQAVSPVLEINRLMDLMGIGITAFKGIAAVIVVISALSIFISLYTRLKERRYELALMRSMGARRFFLFGLIIAESMVLSVAGGIAGLVLARAMLFIIGQYADANYSVRLNGDVLLPQEIYLLAGLVALSLLASLGPAIQTARLNITKTLSHA